MERQFDRDLPEVCDEFMKVETWTSFPNLSTGVCVCVCVWLKRVLRVGHVLEDGW